MEIVAIFRQSKAHQKSSFNHLFNCNEITNQNIENNINLNEKNIVISLNEKDEFISANFCRTENNDKIKKKIEERAEKLDKEAREDYKQYKINEKLELEKMGINRKIRTVLQSKKEQLQKEFLVCFGNTTRDKLMKHYKTPQMLANACLKGSLAILKKKGLDKKNLISLVLHFDEKGVPHCHTIYNDYSFKQHTTSTQIAIKKHNDKDKKEQYQLKIKEFSEFQDLLANTLNLKRGEKGSKRKHLDIQDFKNKKEKEKQQQQQITKKSIFKCATYNKQRQKQIGELTII
jgi:hypothetical protein